MADHEYTVIGMFWNSDDPVMRMIDGTSIIGFAAVPTTVADVAFADNEDVWRYTVAAPNAATAMAEGIRLANATLDEDETTEQGQEQNA